MRTLLLQIFDLQRERFYVCPDFQFLLRFLSYYISPPHTLLLRAPKTKGGTPTLKKLILTLCFICLLTLPLASCSIEKVKAQDGVKPEYTVMKEEDFPDKVKELIEENKESEFQLTYQDGSYLYLLKGYGKQETGGYSIQIEDLSLWDNAIHLQTTLIGPEEDKDLKDEPSYPYLVVKMKYREEPVIFE